MFKKRACTKCRRKINKSYRFCPHCGYGDEDLDNAKWGMLGRDDRISQNNLQLPMGLNTIFNSLMKNLNKQFNDSQSPKKNNNPKIKNNGISISISTSGNNPPTLKMNSSVDQEKLKKKTPGQFSKENIKKFAELPKEEPKTNIRRLADRVNYEIEIPGVKSLKEISVIRLETSIEIKAISKNKAYFKRIPLNFPITNYTFSEEKLILEFGIKG